jgi:nitrate/nitrite transporter NarK
VSSEKLRSWVSSALYLVRKKATHCQRCQALGLSGARYDLGFDVEVKMRATTAVVSTTIVQVTTAFAALTIPSLIAVAQSQLGFRAINSGTFISILYAAAATMTVLAGLAVERIGPMRTCQLAVVSCAVGLAFALQGSMVGLVAGALALGVGYGPITPASSQLLSAAAGRKHRRLIFSFKQTGVPVGTALAGMIVPVMTVELGWKTSLAAVSALCLVVAAAVQPLASAPQGATKERASGRPVWWRSISVALAHPYLRLLSLSAFVLGGAQMCSSTFLVSYFYGTVGYTPLRAGAMLTVANVSGAVFRLVWGAVGDRGVSPRLLLAALSLVACLVEIVMTSTRLMADFSFAATACVLLGAAVIGWNGLLLSEAADAVPSDKVASATAGCLFFSFGGVMTFPAVFGLLQRLTDGFVASWWMMAGANALLAVLLVTGMAVRKRVVSAPAETGTPASSDPSL